MKRFLPIVVFLLTSVMTTAQFTYPNSNEIHTQDELSVPVIKISNELRVADSYSSTDPAIGTLDNTGYGINISKVHGIGFALNNKHLFNVSKYGTITMKSASTLDGKSPALALTTTDDFPYDGEYIHHYGFGFHKYRDNKSPLNGHNTYVSGHFGIDLFTGGKTRMRINQNGFVGIGTTTPDEFFSVNGTTTIRGNIGVIGNDESHWRPGNHTLELSNGDYGDVVLSFHREGRSNATIKHPVRGGLVFSGTGGVDLDNPTAIMSFSKNGDLSLGTLKTDGYKLSVNGKVRATEVKVYTKWADYVFKDNYALPTLAEVAKHIEEKGHLINIPSEAEVAENGINLGEMNAKLLEKIEELTLYTLEQEQKLREIEVLKAENILLEERLERIEQLLKDK